MSSGRYNKTSSDSIHLCRKLDILLYPSHKRRIYTPRHGTQIKSIEALEDQGIYVCGGFEKFKKMDYGKLIRSKKWQ